MHQTEWTRVFGTVYLAIIGVHGSRCARVSVLLMIINILMERGCQCPVVLFYLPFGLLVASSGEHISNLDQSTNTLGEHRCKLHSPTGDLGVVGVRTFIPSVTKMLERHPLSGCTSKAPLRPVL